MAVDDGEKTASREPDRILDVPFRYGADAPVMSSQQGDDLGRIVLGGDDGEDLEIPARLVEDGPYGALGERPGAVAQDDDAEQRAVDPPPNPPCETPEAHDCHRPVQGSRAALGVLIAMRHGCR